MLSKILAVAGRPGLYRLVSRGKGNLIVENITDGKRRPAYARDHVIALGEVSIYTDDGGDTPLPDVLEALKAKAEEKPVDVAALGDDAAVRAYFAEVLPNFDQERVHTGDIRKLFSWYNALLQAGITEFKKEEEKASEAEPSTSDAAPKTTE